MAYERPDLTKDELWEIIENMPVRAYLKDRDHNFLYFNKEAREAHNIPEGGGGIPVSDGNYFEAEFAQEFRDEEEKVLRTGESIVRKLTEENWKAAGKQKREQRWAYVSKYRLKRDQPASNLLYGFTDEITDIKKELNRYKLAVEGANDGLWHRNFQDESGSWYSPRWYEIIGYKSGEIKTDFDSFLDLVLKQDRGRVRRAIDSHLGEKSDTYACKFRMLHKNGDIIWIRARGLVRKDSKGKPTDFAGTHTDITAEVEAENFARLARKIFDELKVFVYVKDESLRFTYVNRYLAEAFGESRSYIIGKTDDDLNENKDEVESFRRKDLLALGGNRARIFGWHSGFQQDYEEVFTDCKGTEHHLVTIKMPITIGERNHVMGISTPINELREERAFIQALIEQSPDAIYFKGKDRLFRKINPRTAEILGLNDPSEAVGKGHDLFLDFDESHIAEAKDDEDQVFLQGKEVTRDRWIRQKDGTRFYGSTNKIPVKDQKGRVIGMIAVSRDITDHKTAEEQLVKILDSLPQAVIMKDLDLQYVKCNKAWLELHSDRYQTEDDVFGTTDFQYWPKTRAERFEKTDRLALAGIEQNYIESVEFPDGRKIDLQTYKIPLKVDERITGLVGIHQDVTERLAEDRSHLYQALSESIGHYMHNRISLLTEHWTNYRKRHTNDLSSKKIDDGLILLAEAAQKANYSSAVQRQDPSGFEPISILQLVNEVVDEVNDSRIRYEPSEDARISGSAFHLKIALLDLIGNSRRECSDTQKGAITLETSKNGQYCRICIADNGPGVPKSLRKGNRLFQPGTTGRQPEGTGLGLYYVSEVIKAHRGTITLDETDSGAQFTILIPRIQV